VLCTSGRLTGLPRPLNTLSDSYRSVRPQYRSRREPQVSVADEASSTFVAKSVPNRLRATVRAV